MLFSPTLPRRCDLFCSLQFEVFAIDACCLLLMFEHGLRVGGAVRRVIVIVTIGAVLVMGRACNCNDFSFCGLAL